MTNQSIAPNVDVNHFPSLAAGHGSKRKFSPAEAGRKRPIYYDCSHNACRPGFDRMGPFSDAQAKGHTVGASANLQDWLESVGYAKPQENGHDRRNKARKELIIPLCEICHGTGHVDDWNHLTKFHLRRMECVCKR